MTEKEKDAWVGSLLKAAPLEVADEGFSEKVMAGIRARQKQRLLVLAPFYGLGIASLLIFFPYEALEGLATFLNLEFTILLPGLVPVFVVLAMIVLFTFTEEAR